MKKHFKFKKHLLILAVLSLLIIKTPIIPNYYALNDESPFPLENVYSIRPLPQNTQNNTSLLSLE